MLTFRLLAFAHTQLGTQALRPCPFETIVVAGIAGQLAAFQMDNLVADGVEQIALVTDHQQRAAPRRQIGFQPQYGFEVEMVAGLVEHQEIGPGKQRPGQRHAHAPAAGIGLAWPCLRFFIKAQTGKDTGGARLRRVGIDIRQTLVDGADPVGVRRRLGLAIQVGQFRIGHQHGFEQALGAVRCFLGDTADAPFAADLDAAGIRRHLAVDDAEQGALAGTVAPDKASLVAAGQTQGGALDQGSPGDSDCQIFNA